MVLRLDKSRKMVVAIPSFGEGGLEDKVSNVFGRAPSFTIVEVKEGKVKEVKVLKNPVLSYSHGVGPIVAKMLIDSGINAVIAREIGPTVTSILEQHGILIFKVKREVTVEEALNEFLS